MPRALSALVILFGLLWACGGAAAAEVAIADAALKRAAGEI